MELREGCDGDIYWCYRDVELDGNNYLVGI